MQETQVWSLGQEDPLKEEKNPLDRGAWWGAAHGVTKEPDMTGYAHSHAPTTHSLCAGPGI